MRKIGKHKFKEGAASFYIVAFSTLILVIVAMSFASIIISEITRTSNDDLSQSAYDSALAGVEDAKLAIFNYRNCVENNLETEECLALSATMKATPTCDMVGNMLHRTLNSDGSVTITEGDNNKNNMMQAYTCVKIVNSLTDYRATLSETNQVRVVRVRIDKDQKQGSNSSASVSASDIQKVRVSWYSDTDSNDSTLNFTNTNSSGEVSFQSLTSTKASAPPTLSVQLIQTTNTFRLEDFTVSVGNTTNRGTVYLVPTRNDTQAGKNTSKHLGAWNGTKNVVPASALVKSNDKTPTNLPYEVYCNGGNTEVESDSGHEFVCSTDIILPKPVAVGAETERSDDTFIIVVSIPYGKPSTDFALEFFCSTDDSAGCARKITSDEAEATTTTTDDFTSRVNLKDVQISIDSTGRANDLYRRVETRLETMDTSFGFPLYAIQLLHDSNSAYDYALEKDLTVIQESNFND